MNTTNNKDDAKQQKEKYQNIFAKINECKPTSK
jgi:hypothetical protein